MFIKRKSAKYIICLLSIIKLHQKKSLILVVGKGITCFMLYRYTNLFKQRNQYYVNVTVHYKCYTLVRIIVVNVNCINSLRDTVITVMRGK